MTESTITSDDHLSFMRVALSESKQALPACKPNPPVGCALVRDGVVVATGYTQPPYQPHAEPMALTQLQGDLQDVVAYVTLEPCSFHQRTPSCAKELIARRIGAVYVAILDPHPRRSGRRPSEGWALRFAYSSALRSQSSTRPSCDTNAGSSRGSSPNWAALPSRGTARDGF